MLTQHQEMRGRIVDTALKEWGATHLNVTSLSVLAEELGITKPALYRYFRNKEELVAAVEERVREAVRERGERFLADLPAGVRVWGRPVMDGRVPTFAVEVEGRPPAEVGGELGRRGIFVWPGHYYAVEPMAALGVLDTGGLVRIGFVATTTEDEVGRALEALAGLAP